MVLVAVGDEDRPKVLATLDDVADVRDHKVDAEHILGRKHESAIDGDDVVAVLEQHHVLADFAEPAERDHAQLFAGHGPPTGAASAATPLPSVVRLRRAPPPRASRPQAASREGAPAPESGLLAAYHHAASSRGTPEASGNP